MLLSLIHVFFTYSALSMWNVKKPLPTEMKSINLSSKYFSDLQIKYMLINETIKMLYNAVENMNKK